MNRRHFKHTPVLFWHHLAIRISLAKVGLSLLIATSALASYLVKYPFFTTKGLLTACGVFLLACAGATLNNIQDRNIDSHFERTQNRPLVLGLISVKQSLIQIFLLFVSGSIMLFTVRNDIRVLLIGWLGLILYNIVYTPLKTRSPMAILPGTLCGALPVLIGWVAAGGTFFESQVLILMTIMVIWQIPHYWLVLLAYQREYHLSKIPSMLNLFSSDQIRKLLFLWTAVFALMTLQLRLFGIINSQMLSWLLLIQAFLLSTLFIHAIVDRKRPHRYRSLFHALNISMVLLVAGIIVERAVISF